MLKGPVRFGDRHLAVFDGRLESASSSDGTLIWSPLGEVNWTCLDAVGSMVFACSLTRMDRLVDDGNTGVPSLESLFLLAELEAPVTTCLSEEEEEQCFSDWVHFGAEAGLYTPGDPLQSSPEVSADRGGCVTSPTSDWGLLTLVAITGLAWSRRRRAC